MEKDRIEYSQKINSVNVDRIKAELALLDHQPVNADGVHLKPSQCYHFDINPVHVLFNTNCPDDLRQKVKAIISKHINA